MQSPQDQNPTAEDYRDELCWLRKGRRVVRFDMIEIISPRQPEQLRARLPLADLKAHAVTFKLEHFSLYEYRAKFLIVEPDQEFWTILAWHEDQLGQYKIC